jgi:hypothetical protein
MVYHHVGIHALTPAQANKLAHGGAVRMKLGTHHTLPLRTDQVKKLHRAHNKGKCCTIELDPTSLHDLHGSGFFDAFKSIAKTVAPVLRPIAVNALKNVANTALGPMGSQIAGHLLDAGSNIAEQHGYGVKKHYTHHDKRLYEPALHGKGWGMDLLKGASKALRPVATDFLKNQLAQRGGPISNALGNAGLNLLNAEAEKRGFGVHRKKRGRPRKGGALIASGYGGY